MNKIPTINHELGDFVSRNPKEYKQFLEDRKTNIMTECVEEQ
jgi:hypothetical protein